MATAVRHLNGVNERARVCLRRAMECERAALLAIDPRTRATYRDLSKQWREMVDQYENLHRLREGALQTGRFMIRNRIRVVERHPEGDW